MRVTPLDVVDTLKDRRCVHILIHENPDGDCIGAGYALASALQQIGVKVVVKCSDPIPEKFEFLIPKLNYVPERVRPDIVVTVDMADAKMLGTYFDDYSYRVGLCIDHHISNKDYAYRLYLDSEASSACEMIYDIVKIMQIRDMIDITEEIAKCIYIGMETDTGCFRYSNTSPKTLRVASELLEILDREYIANINHRIFVEKSFSQIRLESMLVKTVKIYRDYNCTVSVLTNNMISENNFSEKDYSGLANFPMQFEKTKIGIFMKEVEPNIFKVSMRSVSDVNVSEICRKFGGGGHAKAAGCRVIGYENDIIRNFLDAIAEQLNGESAIVN